MRAAPLLAVLALVGCSADGCSVFHAQGHRTSRQSRPSGNLPLVPGGGGGGLGALVNDKSFFTFQTNECADTNTDIAWAGTKITKSFWIKQQTCQAGATVWIFAKYGGEQEYGAQIRNDPCDIRFYVNAATNTVVTAATIVENDWNHIVWVYDGDQATDEDEFKVYVNGVHDTGATYLGSIPDTWENGTADMFLQNFSNCANGLNDGAIDEVDIWIGEAFTDDEVTELYNSGTPGDVSTHSKGASDHCWRMGDLFSGGQIRDECGSAHATLTNASEANNILNDTPPGFDSKSVNFDGIDEYTNIPDEDALECDDEDEFTFCAWVNMPTAASLESIGGKSHYLNGETFMLSTATGGSGTYDMRFYIADDCADGASNYTSHAQLIPEDTWQHICGVYDGAGATNTDKAKIYVNAVDGTVAGSGTIPATLTNCDSDLEIGRWEGLGRHWTGMVSDVTYYCSALSSAQITSLFNDYVPIDPDEVLTGYRAHMVMGDNASDDETSFVVEGPASDATGNNLEAADIVTDTAPEEVP